MKCTKCGYEATMNQFTRSKNMGCGCSGIHMRQCPVCQELSSCEPLMEEIWEKKNNLKRSDDQDGSFDYFEC
ncbi:MAG: hypothetical protein APF81_25815 [Desulfosporosinus sp. BRH_c37]|nr:MAG: hypothetical protein APF81_25815 [Desulfosporosinus sp. BRH_c37]